jgi:hypothetical protein
METQNILAILCKSDSDGSDGFMNALCGDKGFKMQVDHCGCQDGELRWQSVDTAREFQCQYSDIAGASCPGPTKTDDVVAAVRHVHFSLNKFLPSRFVHRPLSVHPFDIHPSALMSNHAVLYAATMPVSDLI